MREWKHADLDKHRYGYQGDFAEKDTETGFSHFELREYDSKIGRWLVPDPYRQYASPYVGMGNDPVNGVDPDGGCTDCKPPVVPIWDTTFNDDWWNGNSNIVHRNLPEVIVNAYNNKDEAKFWYFHRKSGEKWSGVGEGMLMLVTEAGGFAFAAVAAATRATSAVMKAEQMAARTTIKALESGRSMNIINTTTEVWNLGDAVITKSHHNWNKIFGNKVVTLTDVEPILKEAVNKGTWQTTGILRGKGGQIIGDKLELIQEVNGNKIWVGGMKEHATGKIFINNRVYEYKKYLLISY
jgi:RHS repeat-associated protein